MPNYTGTIALLIGLLFTILHAFGVTVSGDDVKGELTSSIVALITAVATIIGIVRLLTGKAKVDQLSNQLVLNRINPVTGPLQGTVEPAQMNQGSGGKPTSRVFSVRRRKTDGMVTTFAIALVTLVAGCTLQDAAGWFGGTPSQKTKSTIVEVYGDVCRAFTGAEDLASQALDDHLPFTEAQLKDIELAQGIGKPICTGPLPVNLYAAAAQVGLATAKIAAAIAR